MKDQRNRVGWIGFFWGKDAGGISAVENHRRCDMLNWLEFFQR